MQGGENAGFGYQSATGGRMSELLKIPARVPANILYFCHDS